MYRITSLHFLLSHRRNQDGIIPSLTHLLNELGFDFLQHKLCLRWVDKGGGLYPPPSQHRSGYIRDSRSMLERQILVMAGCVLNNSRQTDRQTETDRQTVQVVSTQLSSGVVECSFIQRKLHHVVNNVELAQ